MRVLSYSVIIPFVNEEENLMKLHSEVVDVLKSLRITSEVVYVNDGSTDNSLLTIRKAIKKKNNSRIGVKLIDLRRNYGQTAAISAGINAADAEYVSFLDADLQNDPSDLARFVEKLGTEYDAVFGWRKERKDKNLRSILSRLANKLINLTFDYPYHDVGCSARIVKKEFLENLELYGELHRIMPVLIYLRGARITEIEVHHRERAAGQSKYGFNRILKTIIDITTVKFLTSYGTRPAYVFGTLGFGSIFLAFLSFLVVAYKKIFLDVYVHREPLFLVTIFLVMAGMQFILMGLLAEIQVRTYFESQKKTIYEINKIEKY